MFVYNRAGGFTSKLVPHCAPGRWLNECYTQQKPQENGGGEAPYFCWARRNTRDRALVWPGLGGKQSKTKLSNYGDARGSNAKPNSFHEFGGVLFVCF